MAHHTLLSILGLSLLVSACGSQTGTAVSTETRPQTASPNETDPNFMPPDQVQTESIGSAQLLPPADGSPFLVIDPNRLPGMTADQVVRALGSPSFVRRDGNSQAMLYEAPQCVLDINLVELSENAPMTVNYVTARDRTGRLITINRCLEQLASS